MVGISRKSMIYKVLKINPKNALNGTSVLNALSILKGVSILRVHDVKEAKEVINLIKLVNN
jgi:dihydropteroate synthase